MISKSDILKLDKRRELFDFINKNQGLNLRQISLKLDIPKSTLIYHIKYLKKLGIINEKIQGRNRRIFISEKIGIKDKEILTLLRNKIPRRIFLYFIFNIAFSQKEICEELNLSASIVNYHIKKLTDMGIIEEAKVNSGRVYPFKSDENIDCYIKRKKIGSEKIFIRKNQEIIKDTYRVLITHKSSLSDEELIDAYINYLEQIYIIAGTTKEKGIKIEKKSKGIDKKINSVIRFLKEEFIKPPFAS